MTRARKTIFIVEDDPWYSRLLQTHLGKNEALKVEVFATGKDLLDALHRQPDAITLDYYLPDASADELLPKLRARVPDTPVIVISEQEDLQKALQLLRQGARDYLIKAEDTRDRLWQLLRNTLFREDGRGSASREAPVKRPVLVGDSPAMMAVHELIDKAARARITVSITGPSGSGKELVAQAIHLLGDTASQPFVAVNVSAIPEGLVESELFGVEPGAFTSADARRVGKLEQAGRGTLFLDEIGDMDLASQAKLLRVLQEREFVRLGDNRVRPMECRVIVATHRDLQAMVEEGTFREDLYYRILGLPIRVPPLADRAEDILPLARYFLEEAVREGTVPGERRLSPEAEERLLQYDYPGNIRELKAIVLLAAVLCENGVIGSADLHFHGRERSLREPAQAMTLKRYNAMLIRQYLDRNDGNVVATAKQLGIGKSTLYRMLKDNAL
jgi:DNA-binding NtrC family response regulator